MRYATLEISVRWLAGNSSRIIVSKQPGPLMKYRSAFFAERSGRVVEDRRRPRGTVRDGSDGGSETPRPPRRVETIETLVPN